MQFALIVPSMLDRAQQALHLLSLEPVAETTADPNSYGFRPMRACRDAAEQCFTILNGRGRAPWILDADISSCFDKISHDWILANVPMDKVMVRKWLKSGFIWKNRLFPTDEGTPQGGTISPTITNMTLDGLEAKLRQHFGARRSERARKNKVNLVRYADDLVVTGTDESVLEEARSLIEAFLMERGLSLSHEKTRIVHIDDGFDFLGWTLRKYKGKFLIKPSKKNVQALSRKIRETIKEAQTAKQETVIARLNPIIRGWANYHQNQVAKKTFNKIDAYTWRRLWQWACRRHPNKSKSWIKKRYFHREGTRDWVFGSKVKGNNGKTKLVRLVCASDTPIQRHIKIKGEANPFDTAWEPYFEQRLSLMMKNSLKGRTRLLSLWKAQQQRCPNCRERITKESGWHVHHILPKAQGGTDDQANLMLLHPNCHRQIHNSDQSERPAPVTRGFAEARAAYGETRKRGS